jgi:hypothetical protein
MTPALARSTRLLAAALTLASAPASAHVVAGDRIFPVTLTFDDPGVGDEATMPQFIWQPNAGPSNDYQFQWEYDKTITPTTALIYNHGYDLLQTAGQKTATGFENVFITGKWQALTIPEHEFVVSAGIIREQPGDIRTQQIGDDAYGSTAPTLYFGKGLGDLPIGVFRPLAVTGELSYVIPDRQLNAAGNNLGTPREWVGAFSVQYSIPYLQEQVKDYGLPHFLGRFIPVVETDWSSPASGPAPGVPMKLTIAPGAIWLGETWQWGLEALIPANRAAAARVGLIFQVHFFFDDLFPNSLGKPVSEWFH